MPATPHAITPLVRAAAIRLGLRGAARGGALGMWIGVAGAAGLAAARVFGGLPWWVAVPGGLLLLVVPPAVAAAFGAWRHRLSRRDRALLVDRVTGSDEALITALHQLETTGRTEALHHLRATPEQVRKAVPIAAPGHAKWSLPAAALVAAALLAAPRVHVALPNGPVDDPVVAEGVELQEALQKPEAAVLPEELRSQAESTAEALIDQELSAEEAAQRLEELQQAIEQFQRELEPAQSLLEELEEAAQQLDLPQLDALSEALGQGDFGAAGQAAEELAQQIKQATPEQRQQAAEQLQQAGERMQQSGDPAMQEMGEALQDAGESMEQQGQQGQGQQGGGQGSTLSPQEAQQLKDALDKQRELGEKLQRDREKLQRSEELKGATEGAQERLGRDDGEEGEGGQEDGQGAGEGEGEEQGSGDDQGGVAQGAGSAAGSSGHTWEDQGEFDPQAGALDDGGGFEPDDNQGEHIDDFEKFYAATRLDDAEVVLASEQGEVVDGRVDVLITRLTGSDEQAFAPELQVPASYQQEAVEAIETETIPPAYREAVKAYFDR